LDKAGPFVDGPLWGHSLVYVRAVMRRCSIHVHNDGGYRLVVLLPR
jgi:hypothetical protein